MVHVSSHHWHQCPAYLGILNDFLKFFYMSKFIIWRVTENMMCACVYLLIFGFPRMLGGPSFVVINETWSYQSCHSGHMKGGKLWCPLIPGHTTDNSNQ